MQTDPLLLDRARTMRREMTETERRLWLQIRDRRLCGVKFGRQVVIGGHIVDFVARSHKLIVEVDGDTHAGDEARDELRTAALNERGYRVMRFTNAEVTMNLNGVLQMISVALTTTLHPTLSPTGRGPEA